MIKSLTPTFGIVLALGLLTLAIMPFISHASAPPGLPTTIATSTNPALPVTTATVIIATSTCNARVISTASTTVMLTFSDAQTPTANFGTWQGASTTVVYDSGQFGCGQVKAYATNQAGRITVIDTR